MNGNHDVTGCRGSRRLRSSTSFVRICRFGSWFSVRFSRSILQSFLKFSPLLWDGHCDCPGTIKITFIQFSTLNVTEISTWNESRLLSSLHQSESKITHVTREVQTGFRKRKKIFTINKLSSVCQQKTVQDHSPKYQIVHFCTANEILWKSKRSDVRRSDNWNISPNNFQSRELRFVLCCVVVFWEQASWLFSYWFDAGSWGSAGEAGKNDLHLKLSSPQSCDHVRWPYGFILRLKLSSLCAKILSSHFCFATDEMNWLSNILHTKMIQNFQRPSKLSNANQWPNKRSLWIKLKMFLFCSFLGSTRERGGRASGSDSSQSRWADLRQDEERQRASRQASRESTLVERRASSHWLFQFFIILPLQTICFWIRIIGWFVPLSIKR